MIYIITFFIILQVITSVLVAWHGFVAFFGLIRKKEPPGPEQPQNRFAVIVCARNEEKVLVHLLRSLSEQDYPKDKWHVYLLADHCTDGTVDVAKEFPFVTVYERTEGPQSGKGAVLMWGLEKLQREKHDTYDAVMVFDADNLARRDFMARINEHLNKGNLLVQGNRIAGKPYRTYVTKWYACYWPLYSLLFSYPREKLNFSCFLTGTGFAVKKELLDRYGWNTFSMTEDVEFAFQHCLRHDRTSFCFDAVCYDEQPSSFNVMVRQLLRWCTGSHQIFFGYSGRWREALREKFSIRIIDNLLLMMTGPLAILQSISAIFTTILLYIQYGKIHPLMILFPVLGYVCTVLIAIIATQFFKIKLRKLSPAIFFFPVFLTVFTLCSAWTLFFPANVWKPIEHKGLEDEQKGQ